MMFYNLAVNSEIYKPRAKICQTLSYGSMLKHMRMLIPVCKKRDAAKANMKYERMRTSDRVCRFVEQWIIRQWPMDEESHG